MAKEERKLTGVQKAAILFITLGPEASSGILKKLPEGDIQKITYEIANITSVTAEQREEILNEFLQINKARDYIIEGGMDYAKQLLSKALGAQRALMKYLIKYQKQQLSTDLSQLRERLTPSNFLM